MTPAPARPWLLLATCIVALVALAIKDGPRERTRSSFPDRTVLIGQVIAPGALIDFRITSRGLMTASCWRGGDVEHLVDIRLRRREQRLLDVTVTSGPFGEVRTAPPLRSRRTPWGLRVRQGGRERQLSERASAALERVHALLEHACPSTRGASA